MGRCWDSSLGPVAHCVESQQQGRVHRELQEVSHGFLDTQTHTCVCVCVCLTGHRLCISLVLMLHLLSSVSSLVLCTYISFCDYEPRNQMFLHTKSLWFGNMSKVPAVPEGKTGDQKSGLRQSDILDFFFLF